MNQNNIKSIGENIKKYRSAANLTQVDLANQLQLSVRQIGEIETGNSLSGIEVLFQISDILNIPLDVLFSDCDKEFLVFAIDGYLNRINRQNAVCILEKTLYLMGIDPDEIQI